VLSFQPHSRESSINRRFEGCEPVWSATTAATRQSGQTQEGESGGCGDSLNVKDARHGRRITGRQRELQLDGNRRKGRRTGARSERSGIGVWREGRRIQRVAGIPE